VDVGIIPEGVSFIPLFSEVLDGVGGAMGAATMDKKLIVYHT